MKFTQMYSAPICSPARAQLMTGKYAQRIGIPRVLFPEDEIGLDGEHKTIAGYLNKYGYKSKAIGKWHLGCCKQHMPTRHGFDEFYGLLYSNDMKPLSLYRDEMIEEKTVDQSTLTQKYTNEAVNFILECIPLIKKGEIFVPKMKLYNIKKLASTISKKHKIIGLRKGEKM